MDLRRQLSRARRSAGPTGAPYDGHVRQQAAGAVGSITVHLHGDHHASAVRRAARLAAHQAGRPPDLRLSAHGRRQARTSGVRLLPRPPHGRDRPQRLERPAGHVHHDRRRRAAAARCRPDSYDLPLLVQRPVVRRAATSSPSRSRAPGDGTHGDAKFIGPYAAPGDATVGDHILVDGSTRRTSTSATHRYRLRLLNGSGFQSYDFHLSNGAAVRADRHRRGLLPKPVVRRTSCSARRSVPTSIVDFQARLGKKVLLESVPRTDGQPGGIGTPQAPMMQFRVTKRRQDRTRVPGHARAAAHVVAAGDPDMVWTFGLGGDATTGTYWTVNGHPLRPDPRRRADPARLDADLAAAEPEPDHALHPPARGAVAHDRPRRPAAACLRSAVCRTPGDWTRARRSRLRRSSPTTPASS